MEASPLIRLPPELRSQIFQLVFACDGAIPLTLRGGHGQLLETCSQIRREAGPVFYGTNTFAHSFHPGQHPTRADIVALVRHLKSLGPQVLGSFKALAIEWHKFSAEYTSVIEVMTVQHIGACCFVDLPNTADRKGHPVRHFRPAHVESEIIDLYRSMGLSIKPGRGQGSWLLLPAGFEGGSVRPKLEFWSDVWDAEAETLEDPEYWKRDSAKQLLRMLCRSLSVAEVLEAEGS